MSAAGYWHCDVLLPDGWHHVRWEGKKRDLSQGVLHCEIVHNGPWQPINLYMARVVAAAEPYFEPWVTVDISTPTC